MAVTGCPAGRISCAPSPSLPFAQVLRRKPQKPADIRVADVSELGNGEKKEISIGEEKALLVKVRAWCRCCGALVSVRCLCLLLRAVWRVWLMSVAKCRP